MFSQCNTCLKNSLCVLTSAAHILKLEQYRDDQHGLCARMTCKLVKCYILKKEKPSLSFTYLFNRAMLESQNSTPCYRIMLKSQIPTDACGNCNDKDVDLKDESCPEGRFCCDIWPNVDPLWPLSLPEESLCVITPGSLPAYPMQDAIGTWHMLFPRQSPGSGLS